MMLPVVLVLASFIPALQYIPAGPPHAPTAAAACSTFIDNFTTPGALSGSWTVVTASGYTSVNQGSGFAQSDPTSTKGWAIYTAGPASGDECIQATGNLGSNLSALGASGLSVLTDSSGNGYVWIEALFTVYRVSAGGGVGPISMGSACPPTNPGDVRKFSYVSSTHTFTCANVTTAASGSGTDSTLTTGSIGMLIDQSAVAFQLSSMGGS